MLIITRAALQLEQLGSQACQWHDDVEGSKNWPLLLHVRNQGLSSERTGRSRSTGHFVHWLEEGPEQAAQSLWHLTQFLEILKVPSGQVKTQSGSRFVRLVQLLALLEQVAQADEHAILTSNYRLDRHSENNGKQRKAYVCNLPVKTCQNANNPFHRWDNYRRIWYNFYKLTTC